MTTSNSWKVVLYLCCSALLVFGAVLLVFYLTVEPASRTNTFAFTAWFSASHVLFLAAALLYAAIRDGRESSVVSVNSAVVVVTFVYCLFSIATIFTFTRVLANARPHTYYAIAGAEFLIALAVIVLLQVVSESHRAAHSSAIRERASLQRLLSKCDEVCAQAMSAGWRCDSLRQCSEYIRFSEVLRKDSAAAVRVDVLLSELQVLVSEAPETSRQEKANATVRSIAAAAGQKGTR